MVRLGGNRSCPAGVQHCISIGRSSASTPRGRSDVKLRRLVMPLAALVLVFLVTPLPVGACGGFFCTTIPVDQAAERIIFTMDEGSITTYVQINYTGNPEDFAWVLPMPSVPKVDTATSTMFRDLDRLTQPVYIAPRPPACLNRPMPAMAVPASAARAADGS